MVVDEWCSGRVVLDLLWEAVGRKGRGCFDRFFSKEGGCFGGNRTAPDPPFFRRKTRGRAVLGELKKSLGGSLGAPIVSVETLGRPGAWGRCREHRAAGVGLCTQCL